MRYALGSYLVLAPFWLAVALNGPSLRAHERGAEQPSASKNNEAKANQAKADVADPPRHMAPKLDHATEKALAYANNLLLSGKYAEAAESFDKLRAAAPARTAIGLTRCLEAQGERDRALAEIRRAIEQCSEQPGDMSSLQTELAGLLLARGEYGTARLACKSALDSDAENAWARWRLAELDRLSGDTAKALEGYKLLVDRYNASAKHSSETLHAIALGASQYARWKRLSDQFSFLVNDLYPSLLSQEPAAWQAEYEVGLLMLEKYNEPEAAQHFAKALELNPNAAHAHAAIARLKLQNFDLLDGQAAIDRALQIDRASLAAVLVQADLHLINLDLPKAQDTLKQALLLQPNDEQALGRLAALFLVQDGSSSSGKKSRFSALTVKAAARNEHCGEFYLALADGLDLLRRYPAAARYYEEAVDRLPELTDARGKLGLMLMRLGEEAKARKVLDESFAIDPFNVRVANTLQVLDVLADYETLETEHFIIKFDAKLDRVLGHYAADYLEQVYPALVRQLGYEPPQKSLFEIFNKARNTDGHGWFSARMIGLPHVHTIGACAGKMVAMESPGDSGVRFNWAQVLKHELTHVINLQQTNFAIPHWFTEALAVRGENMPRAAAWNRVLKLRHDAGKLFTLDNLNLGFVRPRSTDDWTLAYCQAELYAEYMQARFGEQATIKLLNAYSEDVSTNEALKKAFGVEMLDFEIGYKAYVDKIVAELPAASEEEGLAPLAALEKAYAENVRDSDAAAALAQAYLVRRNYPKARRLADAALKQDARNGLAGYVRARLHLLLGENREALDLLTQTLNRNGPQPAALALLAGLHLKANRFAQAAEFYELGMVKFPGDAKWPKSLAAVYLQSKQDDRLASVLEVLASTESDDLAVRKKLAELAAAQGKPANAARWAREALYIDVANVDVHEQLAAALVALDRLDSAVAEYRTAVELAPDRLELRLRLAQSLVKNKQVEAARTVLDDLLKRDGTYTEAADLLKNLAP